MRTAVLCFCASFFVCQAYGSEASAFCDSLKSAKTAEQFHADLEAAPEDVSADPQVDDALTEARDTEDWKAAREKLVAILGGKVAFENEPPLGHVKSPKVASQEILSQAVYRDSGSGQSRNLLSRAGKKITDWLDRQSLKEEKDQRKRSGFKGADVSFLEPVVWGVLILGLVVVLVVIAAHFKFGKLGRGPRKVLEDDEEVLSSDEWLEKASDLESDGQFREAVRCLYLASLVRLDEAHILRFIRSETNWEHLRRFQQLAEKPEGLDLLAITRQFDRVWYGFRVKGATDVQLFRDFYRALLLTIRRGAGP